MDTIIHIITIKMKSADVNSNSYIDSSKEINFQYLKFQICDGVRISKYKNIFSKGYVLNWFGDVFVIKKVNSTVPYTYAISDLKGCNVKMMERF